VAKTNKDTVKTFIDSSSIAEIVKLSPRIICSRSKMGLLELSSLAEGGSVEIIPLEDRELDLEVGGRIIARGRLMKEKGTEFFQITELVEGDDGGS
jgi:flagellar motor switch/type III secretory pathway protein FliN